MRILLIDDHALFRIGLSELLERRGLDVVAAVGDCEEGVRLAHQEAPDVVLLDMRMPGTTGIDVLQRLRAGGAPMPIAMLTTSTDERDVIASLQAGARGYLLKDMEPDELIAALKRIVGGETLVAPELTGILARAVRGAQRRREKGADRSDAPRAGDPLFAGRRSEQQGDRAQPRHLGWDGEAACQGDIAQTRSAFPGRSGGDRGGAEPVRA